MATRSKKKSVTPVKTDSSVIKRVENSWILLTKETLFGNDNFSIVTLPHPGHGMPTKYCLDENNNKMYEVVTFSEPYRSWFIGETVKSDGSIMMTTTINPIFLVLPRLREQCSTRAVPLEDLLSEKGFNRIIDFVQNLDCIADLKGHPDMRAYKYNEEKTLTWLQERVAKLAKVLREKNIHVTSGAVSSTFVTSNINNEHIDEEFYLKYAHGVVSQYLEEDMAVLLEKKFNFKADLIESIGKKRKSETTELNDVNKKLKQEQIENTDINQFNSSISVDVKKQKPLTAKEKARQKAANGTKTISAFFVKK